MEEMGLLRVFPTKVFVDHCIQNVRLTISAITRAVLGQIIYTKELKARIFMTVFGPAITGTQRKKNVFADILLTAKILLSGKMALGIVVRAIEIAALGSIDVR